VAEALGGQPRPAATGAPPLTAAARRPSAGSAADLARDASGRVLLYYTDAHELRDDCCEYLYPFGKAALRAPGAPTAAGVADAITAASTFVFVSVRVANVERVLYVLPRPVGVHPVTLVLTSPPVPVAPMPDVQEEVTARLFDFTGHHRGRLPPSVAAKVVTRACPFGDAAAPAGPAAYLKFKFSNASCCAFLPADAVGSTFPRVYGAKAGAAEALIHRRGLCGPGLVALEGAVEVGGCVTHAWVALEVDGDAAETAMAADAAAGPRLPTSTLLVLSLAVKTVVVPSGGGNEIAVMVPIVVHHRRTSKCQRGGEATRFERRRLPSCTPALWPWPQGASFRATAGEEHRCADTMVSIAGNRLSPRRKASAMHSTSSSSGGVGSSPSFPSTPTSSSAPHHTGRMMGTAASTAAGTAAATTAWK